MHAPTISCTTSRALLTLLTFTTSASLASEHRVGAHRFRLPDGFTIERVASTPLVDRPIVADLDELGRLFVADSAGTNESVHRQLETRPHRVVCLQDEDDDGLYDRSTVFADHMMLPEGLLCFDGSVFVGAPPSIWKLTDVDGDGVCDEREEWFEGKTLTGCANDIHGPYLGLDGRIYWAKGAFARQIYERPGRPAFVTRAAHIFRARPDGTDIEPVLTGGMDNPIEVAFLPSGERFITTTFFQHPGGGRRDGLIHAIYGGVYGKRHDVIDEHPRTGDILPVLTHLGAAAPCGLVCYRSDVFGEAFRHNLFATLFNMQKVTRHVLVPSGSTFRTEDSDFLTSDNTDFHPTDVLEDADGSLLVLDTGGWYKICCPTSQLAKPDVLGAIYRVRRTGVRPPNDPRGLALAWSEAGSGALVDRLDDPRVAVRERSMALLARRGSAAVEALAGAVREPSSPLRRAHAVWTLARIEGVAARAAVRTALADDDPVVRGAATHAAGLWRDRAALALLLESLAGESLPLRRAAAEAVGRIEDASAVAPLLAACAGGVDRILEHSLTFALIEIGDPETTALGLEAPEERTRRAALIALDQMRGGGLEARVVAREFASRSPLLRRAAAWVIRRRPEWAGELADLLARRLWEGPSDTRANGDLAGLLASLAGHGEIQAILARAAADDTVPDSQRRISLRAMAEAGLKEAPVAWLGALATALDRSGPELLSDILTTARRLAWTVEAAPELAARLVSLASETGRPAAVRLGALAAVPGRLPGVDAELFTFLTGSVQPSAPVPVRSAAAGALARADLEPGQLTELAELLEIVGPMELNTLVGSFESVTDEALGLRVLAALEASRASAGLRPDRIRPWLEQGTPAVRRRAEELLARLEGDAPQKRAHLCELTDTLPPGDARRGQAVFNSSEAACRSCHAMGYLGGQIGPDLTNIGKIRTRRDLLESIVYPSLSFVRSYEPYLVISRRGETWTGVLRKDAPEEVVLVTGADSEARIPREAILEMRPATTSIMPAGLVEQLGQQALSDLIAFLETARW